MCPFLEDMSSMASKDNGLKGQGVSRTTELGQFLVSYTSIICPIWMGSIAQRSNMLSSWNVYRMSVALWEYAPLFPYFNEACSTCSVTALRKTEVYVHVVITCVSTFLLHFFFILSFLYHISATCYYMLYILADFQPVPRLKTFGIELFEMRLQDVSSHL